MSTTETLTEAMTPVIELLMLADRAEAINGKLYMMGGCWDQITLPEIGQSVIAAFAVSVMVPWNATNRHHTLTIWIEDEDGTAISGRANSSFVAGRAPTAVPGAPIRVLLTVPAIPLQFPHFGTYVVNALIPDSEVKQVTFRVNQLGVPLLPPR